MKASLFAICLVAASILAQAQTTKPKTTATATKQKPVATAPKKTTTAKPKTTVTAAKKPAPKPAVATAAKATTAVAPVAEAKPVVEQQTVVETKPQPAQSTATEPAKAAKKAKAEKPEKIARAAKPEKPARTRTERTYSGKGLSVGIRGGANAWLNEIAATGDMAELGGESQTAPGFTAGLVINYGIGTVFSIQPEILYSRRSAKFSGEDSGHTFSFQADANYVEVPLLLKLSFGRKTRFFVNAGPYAAYGLDNRVKFVVDGETLLDEKQKLTSDDARLEYGITGGLGVSIPVGPGSLLIEGRYNYSLGNNADPQSGEYISQQVSTFSVGYLFPLGRR